MSAVTSAADHPADKPLRRDAERNRRVILDAARAVIAEHGLDAGFDEIARRAGVGVGTVYRRFPDREDLVEALFTERINQVVQLAEAALERDDSWDALVWFLESSIQVQAEDRGLRQVLAGGAGGHERIASARERLVPAVGAVLARAQATGGVRTDIQVLDLAALSFLVSSVGGPGSPGLWRRYLVLVLDGLREARTGVTPLPAVGAHEIDDFVSVPAPGTRTVPRR